MIKANVITKLKRIVYSSKRLERIIKGYKSEKENLKVFYGTLLAQAIGLNTIMKKCPRFHHWISTLELI